MLMLLFVMTEPSPSPSSPSPSRPSPPDHLNPMLDGLFIGLILIHTHIGFEYIYHFFLPARRV